MTKTLDSLLDKAHPRMVLSNDLLGIADVEKACFSFPWSAKDFGNCLDRKHCNGLVVETGGTLLAFLIYEVKRRRVQILNMGVRPDVRRNGLGTKLVKKLIASMLDCECGRIYTEMRETNLGAQLFLQKLGFKAEALVRKYFEDTGEDMYQMEYDLTGSTLEPA